MKERGIKMKKKSKQFGTKRILTKLGKTALALAMSGSIMSMPLTYAKSKLNYSVKTIQAGKSFTLKLSGASKKTTASTSNKKIATITVKKKKGKKLNGQFTVKGKKKGTATITVKSGKKKYKCRVTVKKQSVDQDEKERIQRLGKIVQNNHNAYIMEYTVYGEDDTTYVSQYYKLKLNDTIIAKVSYNKGYTAVDKYAVYKATVKSSDTSIMTVDGVKEGQFTLTPKAEGTAYINVFINGVQTDHYKITVTKYSFGDTGNALDGSDTEEQKANTAAMNAKFEEIYKAQKDTDTDERFY